MKYNILLLLLGALFLSSCDNGKKTIPQEEPKPTFQNKGHELIFNMSQVVGNYDYLLSKTDVVYTYTYTAPDGKSDISIEKYIFEGELSYGRYETHQRTLTQFEGPIEQGYDGTMYWFKHQGKLVSDSNAIKRVAFNRPTNFYWFTMFQKLLDPGLKYDYLGNKPFGDKEYDVVRVSFQFRNEKPTDIYQLFINKESGLVDQFLFTVADFGVMEEPLLMQLEYERIDGLLIPTKRRYKKSTWEAELSDEPWINVTWSGIKFNNGLKEEDFQP